MILGKETYVLYRCDSLAPQEKHITAALCAVIATRYNSFRYEPKRLDKNASRLNRLTDELKYNFDCMR